MKQRKREKQDKGDMEERGKKAQRLWEQLRHGGNVKKEKNRLSLCFIIFK